MTKILLILIVAAIIESIGIALLSKGLKEVQERDGNLPPAQIARVIKDGACNGKILLGIALEAVFFGALLYLLSIRDLSFVWPLTSLGFIVTTLAAQFLLHERVSPGRWTGVLLIALGASLISYSESKKTDLAGRVSPPPAADSTPVRPQ
jgi:drug/metabolite transporter (DMT)-like permease